MNRMLTVPVILGLASVASAGEFNEKLKIGDAAPAWKDLPGVDGKKHALVDFKDKKIVVVIFTCNSCPIAAGYEDRIIDFARKHAGPNSPVGVVAINVNTIEADRLDKMQERAKEKAFPYPYLYDETQKIAKEYGTTYTPEFFVLDRDRKIAYMGAMDDATPPRMETKHYLADAVEAVLLGHKPPVTETRARGCLIRFVKPRANPASMNAVEIEDVTKTFGPQTAVDSLTLRVPVNSIYGFIGPNGSGKTTTLRMIMPSCTRTAVTSASSAKNRGRPPTTASVICPKSAACTSK